MRRRDTKKGKLVEGEPSPWEGKMTSTEGREIQEWSIAQMLAGYDDDTWNRLSQGRRNTYLRAAHGVIFNIERVVEEVKKLTGG